MLKNKKIILAITGSVAAYKSIELAREFRKSGAIVRVIATPSSLHFVTPLSLKIASQNEVVTDMFAQPMTHVELPAWADIMVIGPATAHSISKFSHALADNIVSASFLAFQGPVVIAPAMNWRMYRDPIFQENLNRLKERGIVEVPPEEGNLACGEEGVGRMASVAGIVNETIRILMKKDFAHKKVVVTAGPTREYIDPVRFVSNRSSGKMGFSVGKCAHMRGADVTLITGPSQIPPPRDVKVVRVETSDEMRNSVLENVNGADVLIMAAAVADYSPEKSEKGKIQKRNGIALTLLTTPDIIQEVSSLDSHPFIVGFSAETGNNLGHARKKMQRKGMDMIVFNNVSLEDSGFDVDTNKVTIIDRKAEKEYPLLKKDDVAMVVLDRITEIMP